MGEINNERAYELLDEAMAVSKRVKQKEIDRDCIDIDHVYPDSKEDTERMDNLLDEAHAAAANPNEPAFHDRYAELKEIVSWSMNRHKTWMWQVIAGALVGAGLLYFFRSQNEDTVKNKEADVKKVEAWVECDTTIAFDKCLSSKDFKSDNAWVDAKYMPRLNSANKYKDYRLSSLKGIILTSEDVLKEYQQKLDTASTKKMKEIFQKRINDTYENLKKRHAEYDEVNAMKFAQVKEAALKDTGKWAEQEQNYSNRLRNYMIYLIILIPLYIISGYPHGYSITRHRRRSKFLNIFRKVGFWIAAFCFGTGFAMSLLPDYKERVHWSDGRTTTETRSDPTNFIIIILKFGLMFVGAVLFSLVASIIMTVETLSGLIENFDWKSIFGQAKNKLSKKDPLPPAEAAE